MLSRTIYYPPTADVLISEFLETLTEDEELKKHVNSLVSTNV